MHDSQRPNSTGNDFSIGDESEVDSQSREIAHYNFSYDGEEESPSEEGDNPYHLTKETKNKIKAKVELDEIRCLKDDILKALKIYKESRKQRGKQLSARRVEDFKRIHVLARNYKNYHSKEDYLQALVKAVEVIRGGKLIFNRNKSSLKDALSQIIHSYSDPSSFPKKRLYIEMCHYTKIQLSLEANARQKLSRSGLEDNLRPTSARITPPFTNKEDNEEVTGRNISQQLAEHEKMKARITELEEENTTLRHRLQVTKSGGGSGSDSKNSRGKTPPAIPDGKSDSPTHSFEEGSSPRKAGSLKKMPPPSAGVFGMSINDDSLEDLAPAAKTKKVGEIARLSVSEEDAKKTKRAGKK